MNYLQQAVDKAGATLDQVAGHRVDGDTFVLLVNWGIAGTKKYRYPLTDLQEEEGELVERWAYHSIELNPYNSMSYRELQTLAKEAGIPANQSTDELIAALATDEEE